MLIVMSVEIIEIIYYRIIGACKVVHVGEIGILSGTRNIKAEK